LSIPFGCPVPGEDVRRIGALFVIERTISGRTADERLAVRRELSAPLVAKLEAYMQTERLHLARGNDLAQAINVTVRWQCLCERKHPA
jgi:hypothetical protein